LPGSQTRFHRNAWDPGSFVKGNQTLFVAVSTGCFPQLSFQESLDRLVDLDFTAVEIVVGGSVGQLLPSAIASNFERITALCRTVRRLTPSAYYFDVDTADDRYFADFTLCCRLAKATKVVAVTVRSSVRGTPFNEEVERLRGLVRLATQEGVVVGLVPEADRIANDVDTTSLFCRSVPGLQVTLDPSQFLLGATPSPVDPFEPLLDRVCHVRLRDSTKDALQVRVGQGDADYGRLVGQLRKVNYQRGLCADLQPLPGLDQDAELRKMRLFLESLI